MKKVIKKKVVVAKKPVKKFQDGGKTTGAGKKVINMATKSMVKKGSSTTEKTIMNNTVTKGKPNSSTKTLLKGETFDKKGDLVDKYDVSSQKGDRKIYSVTPRGEATSYTYNPTKNTKVYVEMDTTGYSKGKTKFPISSKELTSGKTLKSKVLRKDVPKTLKKMQTMQNGGTIVSKKKK